MMNLLVVTLLICTGLVWVHCADKVVEEGKIFVKVRGQSGKILIRQKDNKELNTTIDEIVVDIDSITEVADDKGTAAGKGNNHKVKSFANQDFAFSDLPDGKYGNLSVRQLTFTSKIAENNATLKVYLYIFKEAGDILNGDEVTQVEKGTVKFNIELKDWQFCNTTGGDCDKAGNAVDFKIGVKSKGKPEKKDRTKSTKNPDKKQAVNYNLGNGNIQLSRKVKVDGSFKTMAAEYPLLEEKNKKQVFTFRFPKFNDTVVYDPAIDISTSGANGRQIVNKLNLFLVVLSVAFARFLA